MENKWKVKNSKTLLETPYFNVAVDECVDFTDKGRDYYKLTSAVSGYVMVVPVKINQETKQVSYVMVEQYRHGCENTCLEFPAGKRNPGESSTDAAVRELKEETGYTAQQMKFVYSSFLSPVRSADQQSIFLAVVGEQGQPSREEAELGSGMRVVELSADELHKAILDNAITSSCSLAALCAVLLKSEAAQKYIQSVS